MSTPPDHQARQRALDPSQSFAVTAPAGSGKTSLLTQRVLKLLALCENPEQVLAITFTRKAAQEMHHRILSALQAAQQRQESGEIQGFNDHEQQMHNLALQVLKQDTEQCWNLLLSPHRLRVQTIDSFCQSLVQQLPLSAGNNALLNTTEAPLALYQEAVRELLLELNNDTLRDDLSRLLLHVDTDVAKLEQLLIQLLQSRGQWIKPLLFTKDHSSQIPQAKAHLQNSLSIVIQETLERFKEVLMPIWDELLQLIHYSANNLYRQSQEQETSSTAATHALIDIGEKFQNSSDCNLEEIDSFFDCSSKSLPQWQALVNLLTTAKNTWRKKPNVTQGFPPPKDKKDKTEKAYCDQQKQRFVDVVAELNQFDQLLPLIEDVKTLPSDTINPSQWQLLDSLTRVLPHLVAYFDVVCARRGQCDFNNVTEAALRALGDEDSPTDLALKLDYKIQHVLVDEFQDTSSVQLELLEKLTAGWQPDDGRTLFVVGDAMQSCYGFRDANVGIFMDARIHGIGSVPLTSLKLTVNFRSEPQIVDWVNQCFQQAFPKQDNISRGAVSYSQAESFENNSSLNPEGNNGDNNLAVTLQGFEDDGNSSQVQELEAQTIVDVIQHHLNESDNKTIAILARNRSHLHHILSVLRSANIPWQAKDVDPLSKRMAVIDLLSLTKALLDPSDRIAWLSILRAPWCGLSLNDLFQVANQINDQEGQSEIQPTDDPSPNKQTLPLILKQLQNWPLLNLSTQGQQILQRVAPVLLKVMNQTRRKPLRQWIQGVWLSLGGPASVANPEELFSVDQFFKLLEQHVKGGHLDWPAFSLALDSLYDQSSEPSRLQVMTIHKAKGLEFDTVIVPGLGRQPRHDDNALLLWQNFLDTDGQEHLLISPLQQTGQAEDAIYQYLKREKKIRTELETTRLLYIACTRAISHLYLFTNVKRNDNDELDLANKNALMARIWLAAKSQIAILPSSMSITKNIARDIAENTDNDSFKLTHTLRLPAHWQAPKFAADTTLLPFRPPSSYDDNQVPENEDLARRQAQQLGILLHGVLQQITLSGVSTWDNKKLESLKPLWALQLKNIGFNDGSLMTGVHTIEKAVDCCLLDPTGRWLLDHRHQNSACELEILVAEGWRTQHGGPTQASYIIDRTFIDKKIRWIIDYKSSQPSAEQSLQGFLRQEVEQYHGQLSTYAELMRELEPNTPIKTALYFPLIQHLETFEAIGTEIS